MSQCRWPLSDGKTVIAATVVDHADGTYGASFKLDQAAWPYSTSFFFSLTFKPFVASCPRIH